VIGRRHDRYVLRAFLAALGVALLVLTGIVVIYDLADRLNRLPKALAGVRAQGLSPGAALAEYYLTFVPFLWLKILPLAVLLAAGLAITWLGRQNELAPLVSAGVPSRRVLLPVLLATVLLAGGQAWARETVAPRLSRRHDDLHTLLFERRGRLGRFADVPHLRDPSGGRLTVAAYVPAERRMEGVWITFVHDPSAGGERTAYRYALLEWDAAVGRWVAPRGGTRRVLSTEHTGTAVRSLGPDDPVPLRMSPSLVELTVREGAAMGLSSAEIRDLADAHPDRTRFRLLLHEQAAGSVSTVVLLLVGLPLVHHLRRRRGGLRVVAGVVAVCAGYFVTSTFATDLGSRGTLNPVLAAWVADVVFGALGLVLWATMDS
jgi:lipopolysaccharide export system permease protein